MTLRAKARRVGRGYDAYFKSKDMPLHGTGAKMVLEAERISRLAFIAAIASENQR